MAVLGSEFGKLNPGHLEASFMTKYEVWGLYYTREHDSLSYCILYFSPTNGVFSAWGL